MRVLSESPAKSRLDCNGQRLSCRFDRVLLRAIRNNTGIDYTQQLAMVTEILRELEVYTRKKTHAFRVGGAQALDAAG